MRTVPSIRYLAPEGLAEAVRALALNGPRAAVLAGGVDLVIRMKERSATPEVVVDLSRLPELRGVRREAAGVRIGALTPLAPLSREDSLAAAFPLLSTVLPEVGGQAHRTAATVGGNLLASLRCFAFDQSVEWRTANGRCRRDGGDGCHAAPGGPCVATHRTDLAPALAVLGATVEIFGPDGRREVPLLDVYAGDGERSFALAAGEILSAIRLPWPEPDRRASYEKLTLRRGIDRPILGIAASGRVKAGEIRDVHVSATGVGPAPGFIETPETAPLEEAARRAAALASSRFEPSPAIREDLWWRREVLPVLVRRAILALAGAPAPTGVPAAARTA